MSTHTRSGRRTVLQDNSWIKRNTEEDEPIDDDPNFGKVVLSQKKPVDDDVSSKSVKAIKTPVNSGTTFNKSPSSVNKSISAVVPPPTPAPKPPVPAKNPVLKTPTSSFTARVFSGANTSSKPLSPVKPSFGEKFPDLTASQSTNGVSLSAAAPDTSTAGKSSSVSSPVKSSTRSESVSVSTLKSSTPSPSQSQSESVSVSTVKSSTPSQSRSESVSVSTVKSSTPSPSQSESVSVSTLKSSTPSPSQSESVSVSTLKSSTPSQSRTAVTNTKASPALEESLRPSEKPSASAPLDGLADSLLSGRVPSQPLRSQSQVRTVSTEIPSASPTLRSPLQTLQSSSRVACTVCGKPIAGGEKMILEELNIISHTACFRCAVCRRDLGGLEAGKSLWVHRERVHCSNCFSDIRAQWYI
ncbi:uncharacterized threonine-rich GPI-anchored glycoprotein PJ4664.02 [Pimephales promelas]|uniref:uncharacterized threonine-rich GPI-anchored glycoprotein PJ4664.02 n=1 Tax=Pimephales promelas TaxID=90988 RepID=UPI0019554DF1|nr:uncharacterized threonine-rich GPI-anchored glycoprotein PJ4664.02 [Pimephales promelas]